MTEILQNIIAFVLKLVPTSPFRGIIDSIGSFEYLGWLNWFFPVGPCLAVLSVWVGVIASYTIVSALLRWAKIIA